MSLDPVLIANVGALVVSWAVAALAAYRSFTMSRAFVSPIYRRRANWMVAIGLLVILNGIWSSTTVLSSTSIGTFFAGIVLALLLVAVLRIVDTGVSIAIESDFFHRDVIRWRSLRLPAYASALVGVIALVYAITASQAGPAIQEADYLWIVVGFFTCLIALPAVYGYAAIALLIGSRRTADRTLKAYVKFLGLTMGAIVLEFLLLLIVEGPASSFSLPALPANLSSVLLSYLIYRAVMSLSGLGRVEKAVEATPQPLTQVPNVG